MIAVCVTFVLKPGIMDAFLPKMQLQARESLSREPNCHQFDICTSDEAPDEVFLYELYTNRETFAEHLATDHFRSFDAQVADMIAEKTVRIYDLVSDPTGLDTS